MKRNLVQSQLFDWLGGKRGPGSSARARVCEREPVAQPGQPEAAEPHKPPELLDDDVSDLLLARFKGEDAMSLLVDRALGASVADAPR